MNSIPAGLHFDTFTLIAEYKDCSYKYYGEKTEYYNGKGCVYMLVIGQDFYIGSTSRIKERFNAHFSTLSNKKCSNKLLQNSFNKHKCFKIYVIMYFEEYYEDFVENILIRLLRPNLNNKIPKIDKPYGGGMKLWTLKEEKKKPEQPKPKDISVVINGKNIFLQKRSL